MRGSISEEGVLRRLLAHMNSQVPSKRVSLNELMAMSDPHYVGRDGSEYAISKEELKLTKDSLDELGINDVKLPIIIMADSSLEQSSWRIEGEVECALVLHLLGMPNPKRKDKVFLYAPHVSALRRLIPTVTVCMLIP